MNRTNSATGFAQGTTLYVGSAASETRLRIYDKGLQMQTNGRQQWPKCGIRWELQLRKKRAHALGCDLAKCPQDEWRQFIIGLVRAFIDFRDVTRDAPKWERSRAEPLSWWVQLTESFARAQLTVEQPEEWGLPHIKRSLMPYMLNLATLGECPGGREWLEAQIRAGAARLKVKHHRILNRMREEHDQMFEECFEVQEANIGSLEKTVVALCMIEPQSVQIKAQQTWRSMEL